METLGGYCSARKGDQHNATAAGWLAGCKSPACLSRRMRAHCMWLGVCFWGTPSDCIGANSAACTAQHAQRGTACTAYHRPATAQHRVAATQHNSDKSYHRMLAAVLSKVPLSGRPAHHGAPAGATGGCLQGVSLCLRACLQAGSPTCSGLGLPPRSGRGGYLAPCSRSISTSSGQPAVPSGVDAAPSRSKAICSYSHCSARQISCQVRRYISLTAPKAACTPAPTSPLLSRPALACRARCHERRRFGWVSAVDCRAVCQQNARWRHVGAHAGHL